MPTLTAAVHLVGLVLVVSGIQKVIDPAPSAVAMRTAGLSPPIADRLLGRTLGTAEASVGLAAIAVPRAWATAAIGVFYLALTLFVAQLRRTDASAGCGCFGASSTPPGLAHLALNVAATGVAAGATWVGVLDIVDILDDGVVVAISYLGLLGIGAGLLLLGPALATSAPARRNAAA